MSVFDFVRMERRGWGALSALIKKPVFPFASLSSDLAIKLSSLKSIVPRLLGAIFFTTVSKRFGVVTRLWI